MKTLFTYCMVAISIIFISCHNSNSPVNKCGLIEDTGPGGIDVIPKFEQEFIYGVSKNGDKLAFSYDEFDVKILNLKTLEVRKLDFSKLLNQNERFLCLFEVIWSPDDNNQLLINMSVGTDTNNNGRWNQYGVNQYIYDDVCNILTRITPSKFGKYGTHDYNCRVINWLNCSEYNGSFILFNIYGIYHISTGYFDPFNKKYSCISKNCNFYLNYFLEYDNNGVKNSFYLINDYRLFFKDSFHSISNGYPSWSPNSKKLAMTVIVDGEDNIPYSERRFDEVWIIDIEKFMRDKPSIVPVQKINFKNLYCRFTHNAAVYITDSTLAVSLGQWGGNDSLGYLYEINERGDILRQLTFEP
ncbi:MAG: hypothetical protein NT007_18815 [Candidatus Kapabacteria bacterium]|nr:hypothetical protein [Candidatus Kapabacteria bacterium]